MAVISPPRLGDSRLSLFGLVSSPLRGLVSSPLRGLRFLLGMAGLFVTEFGPADSVSVPRPRFVRVEPSKFGRFRVGRLVFYPPSRWHEPPRLNSRSIKPCLTALS